MQRLARFDVAQQFHAGPKRLTAQLLFGLGCGALMIVSRTLVDQLAPNIGPFALVYPAILLATLYGHWQAGAAATAFSFFWAWWYVLPVGQSFELATSDDGWRVAINALSAMIVLIFAEAFRRAVNEGREQRDTQIERANILLAELEHRTKNNFQLITSLLEMQRRRETSSAAKLALTTAVNRVRSFADAYSRMPVAASEDDQVSIGPYLAQIVDRVAKALFDEQVNVSTNIEDAVLPREHAVALGLYTNEALTNCAKHAFPDGRAGVVRVNFSDGAAGWELTIQDDGSGAKPQPRRGTGSSLMDAFAKQAGGTHSIASTKSGCKVRLSATRAPAEKINLTAA
jgi:two-component sensor histidine kinase